MSNEDRSKIKNSQILRCLIDHAEGKRDMGGTQVAAGLGLLKKIMPDMTESMIKADEDSSVVIAKIERVFVEPKN